MSILEKLRWLWRAQQVVDAAQTAAKEAGVATKSIFTSKVFYFNLIAGVIGVLQAQGLFSLIPEPYGPAVVAVGNIVLRYVTTQPVRVLPAA